MWDAVQAIRSHHICRGGCHCNNTSKTCLDLLSFVLSNQKFTPAHMFWVLIYWLTQSFDLRAVGVLTGVSATTKYHLEYYMQRGLRCEMKYKLYTMSSSNLFVLHQQSTAYVDIHLDLLQYPSSSVCMKKSDMINIFQVWPLNHFFLLPFCKELLICLEGKSKTPHRENTILLCSS